MVGSYLQFPGTRAERQKTGDPRKSIEELYQNRDDYLQKITAAARSLAKQRVCTGTGYPEDQSRRRRRSGTTRWARPAAPRPVSRDGPKSTSLRHEDTKNLYEP